MVGSPAPAPAAQASSDNTQPRNRGRGGRSRGPRFPGREGNPDSSNAGKSSSNPRPKQSWRERKPQNQSPNPSQMSVRMEKLTISSGAPSLVHELQEKLRKSEVECMICYEMVGKSAPIWSCSSCFSIFHLTCTRKWARAPVATDRTSNTSADNASWRCPGCQAIQHTAPNELLYWCFCGQQPEPPLDYYITPHSCGEPCRKPLDKSKSGSCSHLCTLQCHPGPCPPCAALAEPENCGCGRTSVTRRCSEKSGGGFSCGQVCNRVLSCGRHSCNRVCHQGDCGACEELISASCFCRRKQEVLACGQVPVAGELTSNELFSCELACSKMLACGNHPCSKKCHVGDCGECELSPGRVKTCPCGKRGLQHLKGIVRKSCLDPIPTCGQACGKLMSCGAHSCESLCHTGACPPCKVLVEQKCRCGGSSRVVPCSTATSTSAESEEAFICNRSCGRKRSCGRHRCNNKCCPDSGLSDHVCMLECGKKLRCGEHFCQELCHPGHCQPCLQSSFTDLTCACGRSFYPPPVPCGTPPPDCSLPCSIPRACGHEAGHNCHFGDCPPCVVPVAKECVGKHVILRNVPCGSKEIKCNQQCGKLRKCRAHACGRSCHSGPCDDPGNESLSCGQVCGASRKECSHTCVAACHPSELCPNVKCEFPVTIFCGCERLSAVVPCDTGGGAASSPPGVLTPLQPVQGKERVPLSQRKLACDDECAKARRLKALADALGIQTTTGDALSSYGSSDGLQEMLKRDSQFVTAVEDRFRYLLLGPKSVACSTGLRVHVFSPLPKDKREVIHQLAQRWNLSCSSVGWEPRRYMIVHVNTKSRVPGRPMKANYPAPVFTPGLDVEPRQVVALLDLPRESDIHSLVLRFGGECELVWLNDRNAVAIFADPGRAATALKRVDHATSYPGAFVMPQKPAGWGVSSSSSSSPWRSSSAQQQQQQQSSAWDEQQQQQQQSKGVWAKRRVIPVSNPWSALEQEAAAGSSSSSSAQSVNNAAAAAELQSSTVADEDVVDDWEAACE